MSWTFWWQFSEKTKGRASIQVFIRIQKFNSDPSGRIRIRHWIPVVRYTTDLAAAMSAVIPPSDQPSSENLVKPRLTISFTASLASVAKQLSKLRSGGREDPNPGGSQPISVNCSWGSAGHWLKISKSTWVDKFLWKNSYDFEKNSICKRSITF